MHVEVWRQARVEPLTANAIMHRVEFAAAQ